MTQESAKSTTPNYLHHVASVVAWLRGQEWVGEKPTRGESADALEQLCAELSTLQERAKELDPDPVVCGCREAGCPHQRIAKLPRKELVEHYKARIKSAEERAEAAEAALAVARNTILSQLTGGAGSMIDEEAIRQTIYHALPDEQGSEKEKP